MRTDGFLSPYLVIKGLHLWMRCYNGTFPRWNNVKHWLEKKKLKPGWLSFERNVSVKTVQKKDHKIFIAESCLFIWNSTNLNAIYSSRNFFHTSLKRPQNSSLDKSWKFNIGVSDHIQTLLLLGLCFDLKTSFYMPFIHKSGLFTFKLVKWCI